MRLKSCKFLLTALHCRHETSPFVAVVGWVFDQFHYTIHYVNMYPQYWTTSIGGICIMKYSYEYKQRLSKNSVKKDTL